MQFNPPAIANYSSPSAEAARNANYFALGGLAVAIVYYQHIPFQVADFFKSLLGRVAAFVILLVATEFGGLYHGVLWAILFLLFQVRKTNIENFISGYPFILYNEGRKMKHLVPEMEGDNRWFVERSLGETPHMIEETEVRTYAVDDDTNYAFKHH
jgi:hypothetical protein